MSKKLLIPIAISGGIYFLSKNSIVALAAGGASYYYLSMGMKSSDNIVDKSAEKPQIDVIETVQPINEGSISNFPFSGSFPWGPIFME